MPVEPGTPVFGFNGNVCFLSTDWWNKNKPNTNICTHFGVIGTNFEEFLISIDKLCRHIAFFETLMVFAFWGMIAFVTS